MKRLALFVLLFIACSTAFAQKENNVWVFGRHIGLNFNSGTPVPFYTAISNADFANGSVCNSSGDLLFYTNGKSIWDRNGDTMPNGTNLMHGYNYLYNGYSTSRNSFIVPMPGDTSKYYVCYTAYWYPYFFGFNNDTLYYSVVDMKLNNGLGDVVPGKKDIFLTNRLGLPMAAIPGKNCDIWILTHEYGSTTFKAFDVTATGIAHGPYSIVGNFMGQLYYYTSGVMAATTDTKKIAVISGSTTGGIELFDFDNGTGIVSNPRLLDSPLNNNLYHGACFSPDDTRLYVEEPYGFGIYQFDLTQPTTQAIRNSMTLISASIGRAAGDDMEIGPDGKIYLSGSDATGLFMTFSSMDCISNPNALGNNCGYTPSVINLANLLPPPPPAPQQQAMMQYGLPHHVVTMLRDTINTTRDTILCKNATITLKAPGGFTKYIWQDETTTDTLLQASQPGIYWVSYSNLCKVRNDTTHVNPSTLNVNLGNDTILCQGQTITLNATNPGATYLWSDNSTGPTLIADTTGTYGVSVSLDGCMQIDFINVAFSPNFTFSIGDDTTLCNEKSFTISADVPNATYLWPDGSTGSSFIADTSGRYWVTADKENCKNTDTIALNFINLHEQLRDDTTLCSEQPIQLEIDANAQAGTTVLWSDGTTGSSIIAADTGTYWVTVAEGPCRASDSVNITSGRCDCMVILPTAFSPNGDGKNDLFRAIVPPECGIRGYILSIYDRWGQRVFVSYSTSDGWNGTFHGKSLDVGTYEYTLEYVSGIQNQRYTQKGDVALVR